MGRTLTTIEVLDSIKQGETILATDKIIVVELNKDTNVHDMQKIYAALHSMNPNAKILVMSENWLNWIKGGNESDELLVKLVEAYENYLKAQAPCI